MAEHAPMPPIRRYTKDPEHRAPYWRFRPTEFYDGPTFPGGTYTGDLMYCSWGCDHCWSRRGFNDRSPKFELTPAEAAEKLVAGIRRSITRGVGQLGARISGGEPLMYWPHTYRLVAAFLEQTADFEPVILENDYGEELTPPGGGRPKILIETRGDVVSIDQIKALDQDFGAEGKRVALAVGVKATDGEKLAELTGLPRKAADAAFKRQMNAMSYLPSCENLIAYASFLDRYSDPEVVKEITAEWESVQAGRGEFVGILNWHPY